MKENIYKSARLEFSKKDPMFKSIEKACQPLYISRERLQKIEQTDPHKKMADPNPDEVLRMAEAYSAPELCDYYCKHQCLIGKGKKPLIYDNLSEISASLMSALHFLDNANDKIHSILSDSKITDNERSEFNQIIKTLKDIAYSANSLELWAQKNKLLD